jgi:alpha-L-rhamnosidase
MRDLVVNTPRPRFSWKIPNTSPVKAAIAYISGIGYYEFYLNGNNVDPDWTSYELRTLIPSFDVTRNITVRIQSAFFSRQSLYQFRLV